MTSQIDETIATLEKNSEKLLKSRFAQIQVTCCSLQMKNTMNLDLLEMHVRHSNKIRKITTRTLICNLHLPQFRPKKIIVQMRYMLYRCLIAFMIDGINNLKMTEIKQQLSHINRQTGICFSVNLFNSIFQKLTHRV